MEESKLPEKRNINTGGGNYNGQIEGPYIQGNVFQNIFNILGRPQIIPVGNSARPNNQRLLMAAVKRDVAARLKHSLHENVLINVGKIQQTEAVNPSWSPEVKIGLMPNESLTEITHVLEIFDKENIAGHLLILGNPGSGKTTTLLELAKGLIERAENQPDFPVPVLFNLSDWKPAHFTPIKDLMKEFLILELKSKYGVKVKLAEEWVQNCQILPLLDGLDEVASEYQAVCIRAINQFLQNEFKPQSLVVCSRTEEYNTSSSQLVLNGAICLQALTDLQIQNFLLQINQDDLYEQINNDSVLLDFARTPLLLGFIIRVAPKLKAMNWSQFSSKEEKLEKLLDIYVQEMLNRRLRQNIYKNKKEVTQQKTYHFLVYLAQKMNGELTTEFLIEKMQPSLLDNSGDEKLYRLILLIMCALAGQLIGSIVLGLIIGFSSFSNGQGKKDNLESKERGASQFILGGISGFLIGSLFAFPLGGFLLGLIIGFTIQYEKIEIVETFDFSWNSSRRKLLRQEIIKGLKWSFKRSTIVLLPLLILLLALLALLVFFYRSFISFIEAIEATTPYDNIGLLFVGYLLTIPIIIIILGLFYGLIHAFNTEIQTRSYPNQGIWESTKIAVFISVLVAITLFFTLYMLNFSVLSALSLTLVLEQVTDFGFVGIACLQHFALRLTLWSKRLIPWNYARFLDYSTERLFLQRVGGRYRFIHKLLQDHFAKMEFKRN